MKKRILSLLLAFLMAFSMIPGQTFAADGAEEPTETVSSACPTCGQQDCGSDHINWCTVCKIDDCGKNHCPTCGTVDCVADHTNWCALCKKDNCGVDHAAAISDGETDPACNCPAGYDNSAGHVATCPLYTCPRCGAADCYQTCDPIDNCPYCEDTLAADGSVVHTGTCTAAYVYDGTADVGKYIKLIEEVGSCAVCDGSNYSYSMEFLYDEFIKGTIMRITDWHWDAGTTALWYAVSFYSGGIVEDAAEDWPATAWVLHDYTDTTYEYDAAFAFVTACAVCGKPGCAEEHVKCEICGKYDCDTVHIYCQRCDKHDCGKEHLFCLVCEKYDCSLTHTYCGYCNDYDCGIEHLGMNKPAQTPVIPANPTLPDDVDVSIVDEAGDLVTEAGLRLSRGMRTSLSAWSDEENASYQWQVHVDDQWINIQGQTEKGILVSPAMFIPLIEAQGSAEIRCVITSAAGTKNSDPIPVSIQSAASVASFARKAGVLPIAETDDPGELTKSYVVVQYQYADGRTAAASDFAELVPGSAYEHTYDLPDIPGYKATLNTHSYGTSAGIVDGNLVLDFAQNVLGDGYTIFTVTYVPDYVKFTVIHYWQNVEDDYYTEKARETVTNKYKTGDLIAEAHKTYPGFYNLLYETPYAAADGSTVIEVYYDRYYYLMKFDLGDMGYGVDPVYARYGDTLEIKTPTRAGYTFLGWKLNGTGDTIASADMPTTMPAGNREYVAVWKTADTANVSVVIWGENPDDEGYSYREEESFIMDAVPGETISWETLKYSCGYTAHSHSVADGCYELKCGIASHAHTNCGLICGKTIHTHGTECCTKASEVHTIGTSCYGDNIGDEFSWAYDEHGVKGTKVNGSVGESYLSYIVGSSGTGKKYIYVNGTWYRYTGSVAIGGTVSTVCSGIHSHSDHTCTYCSLPEHASHSDACYDCGLVANNHQHDIDDCYTLTCTQPDHTHVSGCEVDTEVMDTDLWTFVRSDTVTVEADGSTAMNVYYDRVEYSVRFYSKQNCSDKNEYTQLRISAKWGASILDQWPTYNGSSSWLVEGKDNTWQNSIQVMPVGGAKFWGPKTGNNSYTAYYYVEALPGDTDTFEHNNVIYKLHHTDTSSSSGNVTDEERYGIEGFSYKEGTANGQSFSNAKFYYTRNSYSLVFNDGYNDAEPISVKYEAPLSTYESYRPTLPSAYEAGSRVFAGWYLNQECTGEEYILSDHNMPANDVKLYAKWEPVEYRVNYYLTQDSLTRGETIPTEIARLVQEALAAGKITQAPAANPYATVFAEDIIKHGSYIVDSAEPRVAEGYDKIHPRAGYEFIGWFYLDENGEETAFDPENMPVMQHLNLYAKWSADKLCQYNVYFALDVKNNQTGAPGSDGIADVDENGKTIYIAKPVTGSGIVDRTYTFFAKGGEELDEGYREGYFPTVGSHSIVIDIADEQGVGANSYTFLYQQKPAVPYTVKYVDKATGKSVVVNGTPVPDKVVSDNKNVVVTENFAYIQGYMPDDYQKTLVVTAGGTNEIIFLYTKDVEHALYVVNYYIQSDLSHKGWAQYTNLQSTGDIGKTYSAEAINIAGFTLSASYTDGYNRAETPINGMTGNSLPTTPISALTDGKLSGELSAKGMELNFYYTRNLYPYEFRYMLNGTTTKLADTELGIAGYDTNVTGVAKEIVMDLDGDGINEDYRLYDPTETTKDIHIITDGQPLEPNAVVEEGDATVNVATFYYVRCTQTMTITKELLDISAESDPDPNLEFEFSLLIHAKNGYHRNSYDYTKSDGTSGTLNPVISAPNTLKFTLKAGQTITIEGLPTAEYTLSELNLPTGYYNTDGTGVRNKLTVESQLDLTVTNTYGPANLILQKLVTKEYEGDTLPGGNFTFTVALAEKTAESYTYKLYDEEGQQVGDARTASVTNGVFTVTLEAGQYAVVPNMPVCGYTVSENVNTAVYNASYKVYVAESSNGASTGVTSGAASASGTGASVSGTFAAGKTDTVVFTNEYKRQLSSLTINKLVTGTGKQDTFIFHVTGNGVDMDVTITGSGSVTICDLPLGSYTVTEDTDWSWRYSADKTSVSVDLKNNPDAEVTFTNTYSNNRWLDYAADMPNTFGDKKLRIRRR